MQRATTQRKLVATAIVIALLVGFVWSEIYNPFMFILTVPLLTIIAGILVGLQNIWQR